MKLTWGCPRQTKTFLLQNVLSREISSARTDILGRYPKFFLSLKRSACYEVRILANWTARDIRTTTGKNLKAVRVASGLDPEWSSFSEVRSAIARREMVEVHAEDMWKLLGRVHETKHMAMLEEQKELQELIDSLVI